MIKCKTSKDGDWITFSVSGHSEDTGDEERFQVCAGVSTLAVGLLALTTNVGSRAKRLQHADGHVLIDIPASDEAMLSSLKFVKYALRVLYSGYSEHLELDFADDVPEYAPWPSPDPTLA